MARYHQLMVVCVACPRGPTSCAGPCACPVDGREKLDHAKAEYCPDPTGPRYGTGERPADWPDEPWPNLPPAPTAESVKAARDEHTRALWAELHARPFAGYKPETEPAWFEEWGARVPCGECKMHWKEIVAAAPPDFTTPDAYFAWTVTAHNEVNRRLGKPEWVVTRP